MAWTDRRSSAGQIMVLLLLGIVALAGLIFYVVNVGDQMNRRVAMQNAADSAAISGGAWMARSMNVVAMNNVGVSRMLALVPILDAFPLSVRMAHGEVGAWVRCLDAQLQGGVPDPRLEEGLRSLRDRMAGQRDILAPLDEFFNSTDGCGFDVSQLTFWAIRGYAGPPPHGRLWQAAESLDEMGQATAISAGVLAQANAVRYGRLNEAETAFVVPVLPEMPARRTNFGDFESPVKKGLIPDRAYPHRLGPYDRLFKWRNYRYHNITERGRYVPPRPGHGKIRGGRGNVSVGGRVRGRSARGRESHGHWTHSTIGRILLGYTVYGPYEWMRRRIHGYSQGWWHNRGYYPGQLADTFFHEYHKKISDIKLGYIWGSRQLKRLHFPNWIPDYPRAKALGQRPDVRVTRTMFYVVEIRSKYPKDDRRYLTPGTYVTNGDFPIAMWVKGWQDPAGWKIPLISKWVWQDLYTYETTQDSQIGIGKKIDPQTRKEQWQKVYMIAQYVFGGIDVGGEVEVRNPANYASREDLPAPILIDTAGGDYDIGQPHHDLGARRESFTYLGVAKTSNAALVWANRFGSGNPFPAVVSVSQAEIFNTRSWDLWTRDWKVKLVPVSRWEQWTDLMGRGIADAGATDGMVDAEELRDIQGYLSGFEDELAETIMHH